MSEPTETDVLRYALWTILNNTEEGAIPHIAHDGMTAYQALASDVARVCRHVLKDWNPPPGGDIFCAIPPDM